MNDSERNFLRHKLGVRFPEAARVHFPTRGAKQYCRVVLKPTTSHFDRLGDIRKFLSDWLRKDVYLTSGGPSGGTFRLNPD